MIKSLKVNYFTNHLLKLFFIENHVFFIIIHLQGYFYVEREYDGIHRLSFLIGLDGNISHVFDKFKTKNHHEVVLDYLSANS